MHRSLATLVFSLAASAAVVTMTACGSTASGPSKIKPSPGHVVSPTPANAFLWLPRSTVQEANGDYLIADSGNWDRSGAKVVLFSPSGKPVWVYTGGLVFPHSAYPLPHGNVLISDTGNDRVIEVNHEGKIIWNTDNLGGGGGYLGQGTLGNGKHLLYPNDAYPMSNGDILISSRFSDAVYEITKSGKVVWSCARFMNRQHNARLLPNGDLTVADSDNGRVLVINHACNKILFQYKGPADNRLVWPRAFLKDGPNYIVGNSLGTSPGTPSIYKIDGQGQVLDTWSNLPAPFYVSLLRDGNILTMDSNIHGAVELTPNGGVHAVVRTRDPNHYPNAIVNPGFENVKPRGWLRGDLLTESLPAGQRADMTFDTSSPHSGKSAGMISWPSNTPHLQIFWFQTIHVIPHHTYEFTGWMKTKNVAHCTGCDYGAGTTPGYDAEFNAVYVSGGLHNPTPGSAPLGYMIGTQPWQEQISSFVPPTGVHEVQIECALKGRGTAWFDDVTVRDVTVHQ